MGSNWVILVSTADSLFFVGRWQEGKLPNISFVIQRAYKSTWGEFRRVGSGMGWAPADPSLPTFPTRPVWESMLNHLAPKKQRCTPPPIVAGNTNATGAFIAPSTESSSRNWHSGPRRAQRGLWKCEESEDVLVRNSFCIFCYNWDITTLVTGTETLQDEIPRSYITHRCLHVITYWGGVDSCVYIS